MGYYIAAIGVLAVFWVGFNMFLSSIYNTFPGLYSLFQNNTIAFVLLLLTIFINLPVPIGGVLALILGAIFADVWYVPLVQYIALVIVMAILGWILCAVFGVVAGGAFMGAGLYNKIREFFNHKKSDEPETRSEYELDTRSEYKPETRLEYEPEYESEDELEDEPEYELEDELEYELEDEPKNGLEDELEIMPINEKTWRLDKKTEYTIAQAGPKKDYPILAEEVINEIPENVAGNSVNGPTSENSQTQGTLLNIDDLPKLKELLDDGVVTQKEFDDAKKRILGL